jgi:hypothetical protein
MASSAAVLPSSRCPHAINHITQARAKLETLAVGAEQHKQADKPVRKGGGFAFCSMHAPRWHRMSAGMRALQRLQRLQRLQQAAQRLQRKESGATSRGSCYTLTELDFHLSLTELDADCSRAPAALSPALSPAKTLRHKVCASVVNAVAVVAVCWSMGECVLRCVALDVVMCM